MWINISCRTEHEPISRTLFYFRVSAEILHKLTVFYENCMCFKISDVVPQKDTCGKWLEIIIFSTAVDHPHCTGRVENVLIVKRRGQPIFSSAGVS